ncbi:MAG: methionyl-tRNA formyltransferase, partial [Acholeplasmatales bacterium]|nr:methionyl-tRNA formyltransferase [Acholeplasmatales bacterium]
EKYELVLVVSQPAKPEGRKGVLKNPPVAQIALELNLPLFQPEHIKNEY